MKLIRTLIIDTEQNSRQTLMSYFEEFSYVDIIGDYDNFISGYNAIMNDKPDVIFVDLSENYELAIDVIEKVTLQNKNCVVFVISDSKDPNVIIRTMKAGAREFIEKPYNENDIARVIEKSKALVSDEYRENQACKTFSVFSNKGGIGKTTIAANLAVSLADITKKKVALVDLNLQLGDLSTFLDINPTYDISYVVTHLSRIDEAFLLSTLEKYKDKELYVLADPPYLEQAEEINADQINTVISVLKSVFSYIVIDASNAFDSKTLTALDLSDNILLVSMVNLPSIRNTQRCLDLFSRLGYDDDKVKIVVNRYLPEDDITVEDVEDALNHSVYWKISNSYFTVMSSINKGIPISKIEPDSNINYDFRQLAAMLSSTVLVKDGNNKSIMNMVKSSIKKIFK